MSALQVFKQCPQWAHEVERDSLAQHRTDISPCQPQEPSHSQARLVSVHTGPALYFPGKISPRPNSRH